MVVLYDWQERALEWMASREAAGGPGHPGGGVLADDVGLGKTAVAARLIAGTPSGSGPSLVVAPKSLLAHWASALAEAGVAGVVVVYKPSVAAAAAKAPVVVASYSCWTATKRRPPPELADRTWLRVVMDEAHYAKNPRGVTHAGLRALHAAARWALTATPLQNHRGELVALARLVGFDTDDPGMLAREGLMLRRVSHDHLKLPGLTVKDVVLDFRHEHERALYGAVKAEAARELELAARARGGSSAARQMEVALRCRQAATHPAVYHTSMANKRGLPHTRTAAHLDAAAEDPPIPSTKFDYLVERLAAHPSERALVFCEWTSEMELFARYAAARGLPPPVIFHGRLSVEQRDEATELFRTADPPSAMLVNVKCGACGLNLQAASRVYLVRGMWNPAIEDQAIGRAHRHGQARHVYVERLSIRDTEDERAADVRRSKLRDMSDALHDDTVERRLEGEG